MTRPSTALLSARSVGGLNRAAVLRSLVVHGPSSRSDLARLAGVTRATIGTIVQGLLDDGLLEEGAAIDEGRVGKPARPVWFAPGAGTVAAIELRRRTVRGALVDARGHVEHRVERPLPDAADPRAVQAAAVGAIAELARHRTVIGAGVSVPGTCDSSTGEILGSVQIPGAIGRELVPALSAATGLEVRIENDTRAEALAEHWFGLGRDVDTFATVQTGDGLGAGLVLDGVVHRGPNGGAGEIGHTAVVLDGDRCECGKRGCWETVATLRWLRRSARARGLRGARQIDASKLAELVIGGDPAAGALMDEYADHLAVGIANLHQTLGAELFIVHGDAVGGGAVLRDRLRAAATRRASGRVDVRFTELADATLLGAAGVVLAELLHAVSPT